MCLDIASSPHSCLLSFFSSSSVYFFPSNRPRHLRFHRLLDHKRLHSKKKRRKKKKMRTKTVKRELWIICRARFSFLCVRVRRSYHFGRGTHPFLAYTKRIISIFFNFVASPRAASDNRSNEIDTKHRNHLNVDEMSSISLAQPNVK